MDSKEFELKVKELIDNLKGVCANYGLGNDGNEFKILNGAPEILKNEKLRGIIMEVPLVEEFDIKCSRLLKSSGFKIDWEEKNASNRIWVREDG